MNGWKRFLAICMAFLLLLAMTACGSNTDATETAVPFYYLSRGADQLQAKEAIVAEPRDVGVISLRDFVDVYLSGPASEELISPFPTGTRVLGIQDTSDGLTIEVSGALFTLTGVDLTVATCCLSNTICAYTGRDAITVVDETDSIRLELKPDQFLLSRGDQTESSQTFTVYFADSQNRYLISETRNVILSRNETEAAYVIRQLLEGPQNSQLHPVLPEGTQLRQISVSEGICSVSFSAAFLENRSEDPYENYMTVYGVTNTLTNLENVDAVRFLVEGAPVDYYGIFPLDEPVSRYGACIGPVRNASGEVDVNMYTLTADLNHTFPVPVRVKQTISQPLAEAVTTEILTFEPPRGFVNPIPYGTELLSISVMGSTCYIDLSDKFIPQEDTEQSERAALWALVTSLTDLSEINAVVLTIGGENSGLQFVDISEPLTSVSLD